ncbi:MAG: PEP-CTERM sorting domain-containing protein [Phycisphaerae bacterium]|nr:PEP-CTERM sorting domain-containing protein [Phycisphaerae bacterium]
MKKVLVSLLVLGIAGIASAADNHWVGTAGDNEWNNVANWAFGYTPDAVLYPADEAEIGSTTVGGGPIMGVGDVGSAYRVFLGQADTSDPGGSSYYGELTMDGGTLTTSGYMSTAYHAGTSALITMNSGTVYIGDPAGANGHLYLGRAGSAIFNMTGGSFTCDDDLNIGYQGGYGEINLSGGILTASTLKIGTGTAAINISNSGKLVLLGDDTATVELWITNGLINDGEDVFYDYDITTPGATTVYVPEPATIGLLTIGAFGLIRRKR